MKKEIKLKNVLFIGACVIIIYVLTVCVFMNKINKYEEELETSNKSYEKIVAENNNLQEHINDLNENVYKMYNKQPYKINITHDNESITYGQDRFGLFDSYYKMTTHILGE